MEPANRNAWAMYINVPLFTSEMSMTWYIAMAMLEMINITAIVCWVIDDGLICMF